MDEHNNYNPNGWRKPRNRLPAFIGNCRRCGHSLLREDAFCPSCGLQVDYGAHVK